MDTDYPQEGSGYSGDTTFYPEVPKERQEAEAREAAITATSYPIMAEIADWFASEALNAMDITNVDLTSKVPVEAQVQAFQLYQAKMIEKARQFEQWRSEKDA